SWSISARRGSSSTTRIRSAMDGYSRPSGVRPSVHLLQVGGEGLPLRRGQNIPDVAEQLYDALGGLGRELELRCASGLHAVTVDRRLGERRDEFGVTALQLRAQRQQVSHRL